MWNSDANTYG
jgi:hypothetical protein